MNVNHKRRNRVSVSRLNFSIENFATSLNLYRATSSVKSFFSYCGLEEKPFNYPSNVDLKDTLQLE